ncbi:MAG: hypothetical protein AB1603_04490 [Chloroflexota bacterium]
MIETPGRIKRGWQIGVYVCLGLGVLALIPLAISLRDFWPWVPFVTVALWIIGGVVYAVGRQITARPLKHPRNR